MREKLKALLSHDAHPAIQFIKYGIAGGVATVTNIVIFQLAGWLLLPCLEERSLFVMIFGLDLPAISDTLRARNAVIDNSIAFVISNFVCYLLNILFVFKPGRHHWLVEIGLFYAVSGVSFALGTGLMGWMIAQYGIPTDIAFGANIVTALLINYAMRKFVIFKG